ncbi:ankyrin repeat protein, putative [Trichomonas vaginalis G3]|uniref:Ankyrin repeat protein, putative n=1 Tax=Trichomonas vaginalis (strain ATCC PRA-98 / G3) TaxID=412133 RepID=A2DBS1_TRIV3|nr:ankyrin repeat protein family [Trichomonas vaginalis G3]EAY22274.1 ankyrin repeat protein, putative [Trichomonas vaginalis G3]KAI5533256.1 ankyrin repeat protein family [Trichomonas vaginalis G3]|eukprot:XP_001583260.1 ankyrin repeat protein [Trichomonas vaginalis G3]
MISIQLDSPILQRINDCRPNEKITLNINNVKFTLNKYFLIAFSPDIHSRYLLNKNIDIVEIYSYFESPNTYNILEDILQLKKAEFNADDAILKDLFHIGVKLQINELKDLYKTYIIDKLTIDLTNCFQLLEFYVEFSIKEKTKECIEYISSHFFEFEEKQLISNLKNFGFDTLQQILNNSKLVISDEDFLARLIISLSEENKIFFPLIEHVHLEFCSEEIINTILNTSNANNYLDVIKSLHDSLIRSRTNDDRIYHRYTNSEELVWDSQLPELENVYKFFCEILEKGNLYIMSYLQKEGLVEKKYKDSDSNGKNVLQVASEKGNLKLVKYLISVGADKEAKDKNGYTPLIWASRNGHLEVVKYLESVGADKEAKDKNGYTPLTYAASKGHLEIVEYLISAGADKEARDNYGYTPLMYASINNKFDNVKCLVSNGANIEARDKNGNTPLSHASRNGHLEIAQYLISSGANKETKDNYGFTPLILASSNGHIEVVKYLDSIHADKEAKSDNGYTPLICASTGGHLEVVKYLVSIGANKEAKNNDGCTPLISASRNAKLPVVQYLISVEANKEAKDIWGNTPLIWASSIDCIELVQYFISVGANKNAKDNDGISVLAHARGNVRDYLRSVGAK